MFIRKHSLEKSTTGVNKPQTKSCSASLLCCCQPLQHTRFWNSLAERTMPIHSFSSRLIPEPWQHWVSLCRKFCSTWVELTIGFYYELYLDLVTNVSYAWSTTEENLKFPVRRIFSYFSALSLKQPELHLNWQLVSPNKILRKTSLVLSVAILLLQAI